MSNVNMVLEQIKDHLLYITLLLMTYQEVSPDIPEVWFSFASSARLNPRRIAVGRSVISGVIWERAIYVHS